MTIHVVGGVYREQCVRPRWNEVFGSAGRAAAAIATLEKSTVLHAYMDAPAIEVFKELSAWHPSLTSRPSPISRTVGFRYLHDLATPKITDLSELPVAPIHVVEEKVLRFGMLDGDALVNAEWAVYDPQNRVGSVPFGANGSTAKHLALVLNTGEAARMAGIPHAAPAETAPLIAQAQGAEVVVIKMGPKGAFVWTRDGVTQVPAFKTPRVWKLGSGDVFAAHFANAWMLEGLSPAEAARRASLATAYYCETQTFASKPLLDEYSRPEIVPSAGFDAGGTRSVYLAGPFFDLMQLWMVEEVRTVLIDMGLKVFSPFHDVGVGSAQDVVSKDIEGIVQSDLVFAIADGLDAGTIYEIGYARAVLKPVVVYSERHVGSEDLKMMEGTGCILHDNFASAIYATLWEAVAI